MCHFLQETETEKLYSFANLNNVNEDNLRDETKRVPVDLTDAAESLDIRSAAFNIQCGGGEFDFGHFKGQPQLLYLWLAFFHR